MQQPIMELISFQYTITIGDIAIIVLLLVLVKRLRIPPKQLMHDIIGEASWLVPLLRYMNDYGEIAKIAGKVLANLIKDGVIDKETAVSYLAQLIVLEKKVKNGR